MNVNPRKLNSHEPDRLYRYFDQAQHAERLASGFVWISTLNWCRQCEEEGKGDPLEGIERYVSNGSISGDGSDRFFRDRAQKFGIRVSPFTFGMTINNCNAVETLTDAYVICTCEVFDRQVMKEHFGEHCVEIFDPHEFARLIDLEVRKVTAITSGGIEHVRYDQSDIEGLQEVSARIGFRKRPIFANQREVRLLWTVRNGLPIRRFELKVPGIDRVCKVIPLSG